MPRPLPLLAAACLGLACVTAAPPTAVQRTTLKAGDRFLLVAFELTVPCAGKPLTPRLPFPEAGGEGQVMLDVACRATGPLRLDVAIRPEGDAFAATVNGAAATRAGEALVVTAGDETYRLTVTRQTLD